MKSRTTLFYYALIFLFIFAAFVSAAFISLKTFQNSIYRETTSQLGNVARVAANGFHFVPANQQDIREFVTESVRDTTIRMTIIGSDGTVLGDSHFEKDLMENHVDRPEIRASLAGQEGIAMRFSATLQKRMAYVALPVQGIDGFKAVLRLAMPVEDIKTIFNTIMLRMGIVSGIMLVLVLLVGLLIARQVVRPIYELKTAAEHYARGEFSYPIRIERPRELDTLGRTMSGMALQLKERINFISRQNMELNTVLSGMAEPVILLDGNLNIIKLNRAAENLIAYQEEDKDATTAGHVRQDQAGRNLLEVLRNSALHDFARFVLDISTPADRDGGSETEINLRKYRRKQMAASAGEKPGLLYLQVRGTRIRDENENPRVLLVMNDITRLKSLENIRKDFVVNVSHELKTPITAIQGFVETLESGALEDSEKAKHFLGIIAKHTARLNFIINDLLSLSRIEQTGAGYIDTSNIKLEVIINNAIAAFRERADEAGVRITLDTENELRVDINSHLMEQALMNLIDNALKYGSGGGEIRIAATRSEGELKISVRDFGAGIPKQSLPRIFERFYTVDKSRSRELGGTGLGLSIVKHIMNAHGGKVLVESLVGSGSTFTLVIPDKRSKECCEQYSRF